MVFSADFEAGFYYLKDVTIIQIVALKASMFGAATPVPSYMPIEAQTNFLIFRSLSLQNHMHFIINSLHLQKRLIENFAFRIFPRFSDVNLKKRLT